MQNNKPLIGIVLDWDAEGSFSKYPYYALRTHYIEAIKLAGGNPILIPYIENENIDYYLNLIDGLLVPGGFYAMPNKWYKETRSPFEHTPRLDFEIEIIKQALDQDLPLLCICGGMQVLGGILGCKLTGNIEHSFGKEIEHFDLSKDHEITIADDSMLYEITQQKIIKTNSHHKEAIIEVSDKVKIAAKTSDNVIEAIEIPGKKFALGLQWHPEMLAYSQEQADNPHQQIIKRLTQLASI